MHACTQPHHINILRDIIFTVCEVIKGKESMGDGSIRKRESEKD
jgi:hypothetical protein